MFREPTWQGIAIGQTNQRKGGMQTNAELLQGVLKNNDPQEFSCLVLRYERLVWSTVWPA